MKSDKSVVSKQSFWKKKHLLAAQAVAREDFLGARRSVNIRTLDPDLHPRSLEGKIEAKVLFSMI